MTTSHTAQGLASLGRNGDSMLVHMSPHEVAGLNYLAKKQGTKLTINPDTGLPEAFSLGGFFKSLLPTLAGFVASGMSGGAMSPMLAGILAGSATGAVTSKDPLTGALMGGLGGYGGANLFSAANAFTPTISGATGLSPGAVGAVGTTGQMGGGNLIGSGVAGSASSNALPVGFNQAVSQAGSTMDQALLDPLVKQQISMYTPSATARQTAALGGNEAKFGSLIDNATPAATQYSPNFEPIPGATQGFGGAPANTLSQAYKNVAANPMEFIGQNKMAVGMPLGGALLGGLEPSDIYGEPINMGAAKKKQAYDPNATLNLSGDTGLRLYAVGGTVTTGGLRDLYGTADNNTNPQLSRDGYGVGRLENLARQQAMTQAQTTGYAMGGPVSFADGGDSNKEDALGLPSLSPDMPVYTNAGFDNSAMVQSAMQPMQGMQGNAPMTQVQIPDQSNDSLIAEVAANLKADPNYQPKNPIEASIVNQIKGTGPMQQGQPSPQGLGSLAPSQPMAPSYNPSQSMAPSFNPSVAMGPTYFAGINAPQGYADGGDVVAGEKGMNLGGNSADALQGSSMLPLDVSDINAKYGYNPEASSSRYGSAFGGLGRMGAMEMSGPSAFGNTGLGGSLGTRSLMIEPPKLGLFADNDQIEAARSAYESQLAAAMSGSRGMNLPLRFQYLMGASSSNNPYLPPTSKSLSDKDEKYETLLSRLNLNKTYAQGGYLDGAGDGMSDSIPATIEGKQPARLADGEFVIPADVVSHIGNGSSKAGSKRLYAMLDKVRHARTGNKKQGKEIKAEKYLPA